MFQVYVNRWIESEGEATSYYGELLACIKKRLVRVLGHIIIYLRYIKKTGIGIGQVKNVY